VLDTNCKAKDIIFNFLVSIYMSCMYHCDNGKHIIVIVDRKMLKIEQLLYSVYIIVYSTLKLKECLTSFVYTVRVQNIIPKVFLNFPQTPKKF